MQPGNEKPKQEHRNRDGDYGVTLEKLANLQQRVNSLHVLSPTRLPERNPSRGHTANHPNRGQDVKQFHENVKVHHNSPAYLLSTVTTIMVSTYLFRSKL